MFVDELEDHITNPLRITNGTSVAVASPLVLMKLPLANALLPHVRAYLTTKKIAIGRAM